MKYKTLKNAIVDEASFAFGEFSIHDVTLSIRAAVNKGEYHIYLVPTCDVADLDTGKIIVGSQEITYDSVKAAFLELVTDGTFELVRHEASYNVYKFATKKKVGNVSVKVKVSVVKSLKSDAEILDLLEAYLKNRGPRTMKQIQSRFKGYGVICADLLKQIDADSRFATVPNYSKQSQTRVLLSARASATHAATSGFYAKRS